MTWAKGTQLHNGQYIIEDVLGQGAFGITYKALHGQIEMPVVIKTPNWRLRTDRQYARYVERFIYEAKLLGKLGAKPHPHIVRAIDFFNEGDLPCLVMEFIDGEDLFHLVERQGAFPEAEAVEYIRQIGEAIAYIHQADLVHRDIHPGNVMVRSGNQAILIDFGLAGEIQPKNLTSVTKNIISSFAPYEQMKGSREPRIDIYRLAATLYYAVTSEYPQSACDRKYHHAELVEPKQLSRIGDRLNQAILEGMALEAENRPQSMVDWLALLPNDKQNNDLKLPPSGVKPVENYQVIKPVLPQVIKLWHIVLLLMAVVVGGAIVFNKFILPRLQAVELYNQATEIKDSNHAEALKLYQQSLQIDPNFYQAWTNKGYVLGKMGRYQESLESCDRAIKINQNDIFAWNCKGIALQRLGNKLEALEAYQQVKKLDPQSEYAFNNRGELLLSLNLYQEAINDFNEAIKINPRYTFAWHNKGLALEKLGRGQEAISAYEEALKITPDYKPAIDAKQRLQKQQKKAMEEIK